MGIKCLSEIPAWDHSRDDDPDRAHPIGRTEVREATTLTRCRIDRQEGATLKQSRFVVEFGEEVGEDGEKIRLWRDRPLEFRATDSTPGEAFTLLTLEFETKRAELLNQTVVAAYQPSALDWFDWARFKRVKRLGREQSDELIRPMLAAYAAEGASKDSTVWAMLRDLATDPFGGEDYYYARMAFVRTDGLALSDFDPGNLLSSLHEGTKANRRASGEIYLSFGVCENFEDCRGLVYASPLIIETLERARDGSIRTHDGEVFPLTATAQSLAEPICRASIVKALAGPGVEHIPRLKRQKEAVRAYGGPALLASWLFVDELRNLAKRTKDEQSVFTSGADENSG